MNASNLTAEGLLVTCGLIALGAVIRSLVYSVMRRWRR